MEPKKDRGHAAGGKWYVVHQHQDAEVVQADEPPSSEVGKGERLKSIHGPFATRELARERADKITSRSVKSWAEKGGK